MPTGTGRGCAEAGHERVLVTRFGEVRATRIAYRARGLANVHPADAVLNLPVESYSHGLRRLDAIERATTVRIGKRQVEQLAARAAVDVDNFYAAHTVAPGPDTDALVMT